MTIWQAWVTVDSSVDTEGTDKCASFYVLAYDSAEAIEEARYKLQVLGVHWWETAKIEVENTANR